MENFHLGPGLELGQFEMKPCTSLGAVHLVKTEMYKNGNTKTEWKVSVLESRVVYVQVI